MKCKSCDHSKNIHIMKGDYMVNMCLGGDSSCPKCPCRCKGYEENKK